jgi:hypothetical protein
VIVRRYKDELVDTHAAFRDKLAVLDRQLVETRAKVLPSISEHRIDMLVNQIKKVEF